MSSFKAENIIRDHLDAEALSLAGMHLTSLEGLLPLLAQMPSLRSLDVSHNELRVLPTDLAVLETLEELNLAFNPIWGLHHIIDGLQTLKNLKRLTVTLPIAAEEEQLIMRLPTLTMLNGTALTEMTENDTSAVAGTEAQKQQQQQCGSSERQEKDADFAYWNSRDSEGIEDLFADVSHHDTLSTQEFFDYMSRVVQHVTCLTAAEDDVFAQEGEVLKARRLLYEFCFGNVIRNTFKDGQDALGRQLQALLRYESAMMDQYDMHWRRALRDRDTRLAHMKRDMQDAMADIQSLMEHLPTAEEERQQQQQPRQGSTTSGGGAAEASQFRNSSMPAQSAAASATPLNRSAAEAAFGASPQPLPPAPVVAATASGSRRTQRPPSESHRRKTGYKKVLSLKQLKEIIEGIYTSKTKYDERCKQNQLPRETMEQHMYTYLNQKYGLREIILEWATAIVQAVRRYAAGDNDVAVFGKILRNEIDEEFRFVQQHVRETVKELLRLQIKTKRPLGGVAEMNRALQESMSGTVAEDEWKEVVKYMYNAADAALITSIIHQYLYRQSLPKLQRHREEEVKLSPTAVYSQLLYKDFVRLLLDFQLDGHERFLERYVGIFRRHDGDRNGIVNNVEFAAIVHELDPTKPEEEVEAMVHQIDPYGSQLITFSESISFLNDELLKLTYSQHDAQE
jgi:Ca2+-binding EF-hand superfamily protein